MPDPAPRLVFSRLISLSSGVIELERNWPEGSSPQLTLGPGALPLAVVEPAPAIFNGRFYGYCLLGPQEMAFVLSLGRACEIDPLQDRLYVAGDFNGWQKAVGQGEWEMVPGELGGERVLIWRGPLAKVLGNGRARFKFVTGENLWLRVPNDAPNVATDESGTINRVVDPDRTGRHIWRFTSATPLDLAQPFTVSLPGGPPMPISLGFFFHDLETDLPLGARVEAGRTQFRLFAPRALSVTLHLCEDLSDQAQASTEALIRRADAEGNKGVWELTFEGEFHGWFYWYTLDGVESGPDGFHPDRRVLDPYAWAAVGTSGPGIILSRQWLGQADRQFRTPAWQDLVIAEAHVRDLTAQAPVSAGPAERLGFTGLRHWVESPEFYLHALGVNCVELQPIQQSDTADPATYGWGYMTTNFFAPEASYSLGPAAASGVRELQDLVTAFHRRGIAVLADVVFNHVGLPAHLMAIDRFYYFEEDHEGRLSNWSGCGNDLRADAGMAKRLIIDACIHLIEVYGFDGFRFDLAELIGVDVLREIERALKRVKPDVILIAEPWSFRGHIAGALRDTGWASWNDGYRDFVREYVLGRGGADRLEYFLRGSPWYFAKWPAQTINYTQSHDDRTWLDTITENPGQDGAVPTANDQRRTRMMAAILCMSLGIPMFASGQDFLGTKQGVNNTYLRGDLNALDYRRLRRYLGTHVYFADWIRFRRGHHGRLLRQFARPSEDFFTFVRGDKGKAMAVVVNADRSQGPDRLLFALNPLVDDVVLPLGAAIAAGPWRQWADQDRFYPPEGDHGARWPVEAELFLPGLGCGLWVQE
jgi:pullulanase